MLFWELHMHMATLLTQAQCAKWNGGLESHKESRVGMLANTPLPSPAISMFAKLKVSPQSTNPAPRSDRRRTFDPVRPKDTLPQLKMTVTE